MIVQGRSDNAMGSEPARATNSNGSNVRMTSSITMTSSSIVGFEEAHAAVMSRHRVAYVLEESTPYFDEQQYFDGEKYSQPASSRPVQRRIKHEVRLCYALRNGCCC